MRTSGQLFRICVVISFTVTSLIGVARAGGTLETTVTSGSKYRALRLDGSFDLASSWSAGFSVAQENSKIDYTAVSRQLQLDAAYRVSDAHSVRAGFGYQYDGTNAIGVGGPSAGYTYTWRKVNPDPEAGEAVVVSEVLSLFVDANLTFYRAGVPQLSRVHTAIGDSGALRLTQFRPYLEVDKPLFERMLIAFAGAGYYLYSDAPSKLISVVARDPLLSRSGAGWMIGGLAKSNWVLGAIVNATAKTSVRFDAGGYRSALEDSHSIFFGFSASHLFKDELKVSAGMNRGYTFSGEALSFFNAGVAYLF